MTGSFFNSLDYFYIFLVLISCLVGLFRGFIKDFLSTCSWLGSGFASAFISPSLAYNLQTNKIVSNPTFAKIAAVVISFTVVLITLQLTVNVLSRSVKSTMLSGLDRAFGALYGFVRGLIILIVIYICAAMFNFVDSRKEFIANSKITPILINVSDYLMPKIVNIPKIKRKVSHSQTDDYGFTEEDFREMERFSRGRIRKTAVDQNKQKENSETQLGKIGSSFRDFFSKFFDKSESRENLPAAQSARPVQSFKERLKIKNKEDNVQFGCMDLIKARAKRKAQKKARKKQKESKRIL